MYDVRKTDSGSFFIWVLVLVTISIIVFSCAEKSNQKPADKQVDNPSITETPAVEPETPSTLPLEQPEEPVYELIEEDINQPVSEKKDPSRNNPIGKKPLNPINKSSALNKEKGNEPSDDMPPLGTTPPVPDERKQLLEGAVNFIQGNMVHVIPDSMPLKEVSKVSLVIGNRTNIKAITEKALGLSGVKDTNRVSLSKNITIGRKMKAVLHDPKAKISPVFEITPITSEEQFVDLYNNESVDWLWNVIPLKAGTHEMNLTLEVTLKNDLGESIRSIPVYNDKVNIFVPKGEDIPMSYDIAINKKDTTSATVQNNDLASKSTPPKKESTNSYLAVIAGGGVAVLGIFIFLFYRKQNTNTSQTRLAKFSLDELNELDHLQNKGNIQQSLRYVLEKLPDTDPRRNEIELLWQNYKDNERDNTQNLIAYEQYTQARSKISLAVITLIDEIKELSNIQDQKNQPA